MLTSLLPGLRQIRAPLSSGFVWLLGLWILLQPRIADGGELHGFFHDLGQALGDASTVGQGAALAFLAYLLGSLSIGVLGQPVKRVLPWKWVRARYRSTSSLRRLGRLSRIQLEVTLGFSGVDVDELLGEQGVEVVRLQPALMPSKARLPVATGPTRLTNRTPGVSAPVDLTKRRELSNRLREEAIERAVLAELDDVAVSRLLGKDPELYGEWDRDNAEVEFRVALVPPLLFLSVALAATRGEWWLLAVPVAVAVCFALLRDAARSEVQARDVLIVALADKRVGSPVIERLMSAAADATQYGTSETLQASADKASSALSDALELLDRAGASEPAAAHEAEEVLSRAAAAFGEGKPLFDPAAVERFENALAELRPVAQAWVDIIEGRGAPSIDMRAAVQAAHAHHAGFQQAIRAQRARLAAPALDEGAGS